MNREVELVAPDVEDIHAEGSSTPSEPNGSTSNCSATNGSTPHGSTPKGSDPVREVEAHINVAQDLSSKPRKQLKYPHLNQGGNTPDNAYGAGGPRSEVRPLDRAFRGRMPRAELRDQFCERLPAVLELCDRLVRQAQDGELRTTEVIKLLDVVAKYSVGPVQTQEHTGEDGGAVKVQFSFGGPKPEAQAYLNSVRRRIAEQQALPADRTLSDNDQSDVRD